MPYAGLLPKSGCTAVAPEPLISAMYAAERDETGVFEMSVFHALFAGSTGHPPTFGTGVVLPQVEAIVTSAAPIAKWVRRVGTPGYRQTGPISGASRLERARSPRIIHAR